MKSKKRYLSLSVVALVLQGCGGNNNGNIDYCTLDGESAGSKQMQFELPDTDVLMGDNGYPTILFVPGNGPKGRTTISGMRSDMDTAKAQGYAVAAINYDRTNIFSMIDDSTCSVRHLKSLDGVDPERIGLFAHSLGGMPAGAIASGTYASDVLAELGEIDMGSLTEEERNNICDASINTDMTIKEMANCHIDDAYKLQEYDSIVAAAAISNSGVGLLAAATKDMYRYSTATAGFDTKSAGLLSCDSSDSNYYEWDQPFIFNLGVDYGMIAKLTGLKPWLLCDGADDTPKPNPILMNVRSLNIADSLYDGGSSRRTAGPDANAILIINGAKDTLVPPFNSMAAREHFSDPLLNRITTPLVKFKYADHSYNGKSGATKTTDGKLKYSYQAALKSTYMSFFNAVLVDGLDHSDVEYCQFFDVADQDHECEIIK